MMKQLLITLGLTAAICSATNSALAAKDKEAMATPAEKAFIMKAANGGMTEVELGKVAEKNGASQPVKDFGKEMVTDHGKANDQLKQVASKMGVMVPAKIDASHQAKVNKMSGMSGAAFDKGYVNGMVMAHKKDIADFEKADKEVQNPDLKKFIEKTIPVMQKHLEMIEKFDQAKKG